MADFLLNSLKIPTQFMPFKLHLNAKIILNSKFSTIYLFIYFLELESSYLIIFLKH
jgi:hypothetical protein